MTLEQERLVSELRGAVERGEIIAHYQPQVTVDTRRITAAEVLSRWIHPVLGVISPNVFIPLAERHGLIGKIGERMIRLACASAASWQDRARPIEVAVNVSGIQLADPAFADNLIAEIRAAELNPELLTVEVTETEAILDVSEVAERLDWLRSVGVTVSVDDFGAGYSSVEQVLNLRATELKIDQSLVQNDSGAAKILLAAVTAFSHEKGLRVVAEGVESEAQFQRVRELRCDRAQGYLLGKPMPKAAFDRVLAGISP